MKRRTDTVFALAVCGCFTMLALTALLFSAQVYKNIADLSADGRDERLCLSYVWTKVKNNDAAGRVYTGSFDERSALFLDAEYEGTAYQTVIYLYDGWLCELFAETGLVMSPEDGKRVLAAERFEAKPYMDGLIKLTVNYRSLYIRPSI